MDELASFLQTMNGPSSISPNNPLFGQDPSANPSNPAMNPSNPGAFTNPSNPAMNPSNPGAVNNPSNPKYNPALPGAQNNPANPAWNPAFPGAMTNPSNPQLNPAFPGAINNPANPAHNPSFPTPSENPPPPGISENASVPPNRWSSLSWDLDPINANWEPVPSLEDPALWGGGPEHQLWYGPGPRMERAGEWGRGFVHAPMGDPNQATVYTWPESEATHAQMAESMGIPMSEIARFEVHPSGGINPMGATMMFKNQIEQADPRLRVGRVAAWTRSRRQSDNYTQDTREWPDPTQPRPSTAPAQQGCTCHQTENGQAKLDCPIHGMHAEEPDLDHTWALPQGWAVGYPQDQPRGWTDAVQSSHSEPSTIASGPALSGTGDPPTSGTVLGDLVADRHGEPDGDQGAGRNYGGPRRAQEDAQRGDEYDEGEEQQKTSQSIANDVEIVQPGGEVRIVGEHPSNQLLGGEAGGGGPQVTPTISHAQTVSERHASVNQLAAMQEAIATLTASVASQVPSRPRKLVIHRDEAGRMAAIEEA